MSHATIEPRVVSTAGRVAPVSPPEFTAPGSAAAEAAADALLLRARRCGRRLAGCLRRAAEELPGSAAGLLDAADALDLSCAYHTEAELRARPRVCGRSQQETPLDESLWGIPVPADGCLSTFLAGGVAQAARRLGLAGRQAEVWARHLNGCSLWEISGELRISQSTVRILLRRAQRKASQSWLAAYREGS